ncbi:sulfate transporter family-domain-containing protein [Elsinoe ampelina]|uniref:Sulfate transporter family-domain-containing protein n=1 Tax=Elsinoe ampelina TaxID=302913 RepID=A0A6A6GHA2_9PEZI|nr:sulfate transporter family-domain-containing protein [Elsinoe ampelina]
MKLIDNVRHSFKTDVTWERVGIYGQRGARAAPRRALEYLIDKVPIVGWLPRYNPRWLISDVVAGLTLGIMLIPQSLAYAQIADIPVEYGLMASWLPATLYAFMGTSKDLSTGPTSLIGLLTAKVVHQLQGEYTPQAIAGAVSFWMGAFGMILGFLKLGFLLEFISEPVLTGFISAAAITIGLGQVDNLLGESDVRDGIANTIHDIFAKLPEANGRAAGVGISAILLLCGLQHIGTRWGKTNKIAWLIGITRAFTVLVLYTGISYAVNKGRGEDDYLFSVSEVDANGIQQPAVPDTGLLMKSVGGAIAAFIAAAVEHVAIARAFGARNNYLTDPSQELCYLGVTNIANSFFQAMGVGGAMSRTAVNSQCNVRSPLSGFVTTGVVLISLYFLSGALYWIPKATLAAIIITAIWPLVGSWRTYYHFWRTSLVDFIAAMLAFWISLFVATEYGILAGVGWGIVYFLLRQAFANTTIIGSDSTSELARSLDSMRGMPTSIPSDTRIFRFTESVFFPNATRIKNLLVDGVQTFHAPAHTSAHGSEKDRMWSVVSEKRVKKLRKRAGIDVNTLSPLRVLVFDFTKVTFTDATAMHVFKEVLAEVRKYAGAECELRFAGISDAVKHRFERAEWDVRDGYSAGSAADVKKMTVFVFRNVADAVNNTRRGSETSSLDINEKEGPKGVVRQREEV